MEIVTEWTARHACALQAALRHTNGSFARMLRIGERTVTKWHAEPRIVPRAPIQRTLQALYRDAPEDAQALFAQLLHGADQPSAQALRVAISLVARENQVLLVCRRGDEAGGIKWQLPAGVIKPGVLPETAAVREVLAETGVHCAVEEQMGERVHPVTGAVCLYFRCSFLAGEASNRDPEENIDVMWVPRSDLTRFIKPEIIYPPILAALEGVA